MGINLEAAQANEENWSGNECLQIPFSSLLFLYVPDSMDLSKTSVSMFSHKSAGCKKITNDLAKVAKY